MKKSLLTLCFLAVGIGFQAQLTYVGPGAVLTVQNQALVYSGGGWQNAEDTSNYGKVDNYGNIMIEASSSDVFKIANTVSTNAFNLKYTGSNVYGQLYIKGIPQSAITGKVNKEFTADFMNNSGGTSTPGQQQIGFPFIGFTAGDLDAALTKGWLNLTDGSLTTHGRWALNSMYRWNNDSARFDQITGSTNYMSSNNGNAPTDYYAIPVVNATGAIQWTPNVNLKSFVGNPSSDQDGYHVFTMTNTSDAIDFGTNGIKKNAFGERYNTYLDDPFTTGGGGYGGSPAWDINYGHFLFQLSNPFLTNIDLSHVYNSTIGGATGDIGIANLKGIAYYGAGSNTYQVGVGSQAQTASTKIATVNISNGLLQAGDMSALFLKPMQAFMVKLSAKPTSPNNKIDFSGLRLFKQSLRTSATYSGPTTQKITTGNVTPQDVKQVAVVLYDANGDEVGRTYYAVTANAYTGYISNNTLQAYNEISKIYTSEEKLTGGADENQNAKLYINAANEIDFAGKAIPMTISSGSTGTTLKFELYEAGKRVASGAGLSTGKSFYIEKDGQITQIFDGDSQPVASSSYNLYYETPSGTLATTNTNKGNTVVAKKGEDWVIRFSKDWKTANVDLYSAAGQLIYSKKNISTTSDFVIPVQINGMYIVRTTSESGEVVVKKILK